MIERPQTRIEETTYPDADSTPAPVAGDRPAAAVAPARRRRFNTAGTGWAWAFVALVVAALLTRLVGLSSLPATLTGTELIPLTVAWLGVPAADLPPGPAHWLLGVSRNIFGPTALAARLPFALISALTVIPLLALAGRYLSPGGALVAGLVYVMAPWGLVTGRAVEPGTIAPLLLLGSLWLLVRGISTGGWGWALGAGLVAGLGFLGDPASRVVPLLVLAAGLLAFYRARRATSGPAAPERGSVAGRDGETAPSTSGTLLVGGAATPAPRPAGSRTTGRLLGALAGGLLLGFGLAAIVLPGGPAGVWATYWSESIFAAPPDLWPGLFVTHLWNTIRAFFLLDAAVWQPARPFPPGSAVFDTATGILLIVGLVLGLRYARRVALWWGILLGTLVVNQVIGAASPDLEWATVALPAFAFFVGLAWELFPVPTLGARRLAQIVVLAGLIVVATLNVTALLRWQTAPEFVRARQPAVDAESLPVWVADQERLLAAGQPIADPAIWSQQQQPVAAQPPAGQPARPAAPIAPPSTPGDLAAQPVLVIGGSESGPLAFGELTGVALAPSGALWIADAGNRRVIRLSPEGEPEMSIEGAENSPIAEPWDLAVGQDGTVYVLDTEQNAIVVLGPNGERRGVIAAGAGMFRPRGIAVDRQGNLVVADTGVSRVLRLSPSGDVLSELGGRDSQLFNQPTGVAVDGAGNLYVVEPESSRVTRFAPDGQLATAWPSAKTDTRFAPRLAITPNGLVALVSPATGRLDVYTPAGQALAGIDLRALPPFSPARPFGIAVQGERAAVIDLATKRIGIFNVAWPGQGSG